MPITADRGLAVIKRYPCIVHALDLLEFQHEPRKVVFPRGWSFDALFSRDSRFEA